MKARRKTGPAEESTDKTPTKASTATGAWDPDHVRNLEILCGGELVDMPGEMDIELSPSLRNIRPLPEPNHIRWETFAPRGSEVESRVHQILETIQALLFELAPAETRAKRDFTYGGPCIPKNIENLFQNSPPSPDHPVNFFFKGGDDGPGCLVAALSYGIRLLNSYPPDEIKPFAERLLAWPQLVELGGGSTQAAKDHLKDLGLGNKRVESNSRRTQYKRDEGPDVRTVLVMQLKEIHAFILEGTRLQTHSDEEAALFVYNANHPEAPIAPWWEKWQGKAAGLPPFGLRTLKQWNEVLAVKVTAVLRLPPEIPRSPDLTYLGMDDGRNTLRTMLESENDPKLNRLVNHLAGKFGHWVENKPFKELCVLRGKALDRSIPLLGRSVSNVLRKALQRLANERDRGWVGNPG